MAIKTLAILLFLLSANTGWAWGWNCKNQYGGRYSFDGNSGTMTYSGPLSAAVSFGTATGTFFIVEEYRSFGFDCQNDTYGLHWSYHCHSGDMGRSFSCQSSIPGTGDIRLFGCTIY